MEYTKLVAEIRRNFKTDVDKRFRVGELVYQAIVDGTPWVQLGEDVGVSRPTLETHRDTWRFWRDQRAPLAHSWSDYVRVALWKQTKPDYAREAKRRLLGGEDARDVFDDLRDRGRAEQPKLPPRDPWQTAIDNVRAVRAQVELASGQPISDRLCAELTAEVTELLALLKAAGVMSRRRSVAA